MQILNPKAITGQFKVIVDGVLREYDNYAKIPPVIEEIILFVPDQLEGPHTSEEHQINEAASKMIFDLMKRIKKVDYAKYLSNR